MNKIMLDEFEAQAKEIDLDLSKVSAMPSENPYSNPITFASYQWFCKGILYERSQNYDNTHTI